jgi:hypothetical protein
MTSSSAAIQASGAAPGKYSSGGGRKSRRRISAQSTLPRLSPPGEQTDEDQLVARSLMHLISLAPNDPKSS